MTDRAVSSTVEFVLTLAVATALMGGLIIGATNMTERQHGNAVESQMQIVGHQIAGGIESADRVVATSRTISTFAVERDLPDRLVNARYTVEITTSAVLITTDAVDRSTRVAFDTETPVSPTSVNGGDLAITKSASRLVIERAD